MRTVIAKEGFTAYPNGTRTHYPVGEPLEVSNALADEFEAKGLVTVEAESRNEGRGRKPVPDEKGVAAAMPVPDPEPVVTTD